MILKNCFIFFIFWLVFIDLFISKQLQELPSTIFIHLGFNWSQFVSIGLISYIQNTSSLASLFFLGSIVYWLDILDRTQFYKWVFLANTMCSVILVDINLIIFTRMWSQGMMRMKKERRKRRLRKGKGKRRWKTTKTNECQIVKPKKYQEL